MDASARELSARHPYRNAALVLAGLVFVTVLAAAALYVWLGRYAPLSAAGSFAPGPGVAAPTGNSGGGKPSYVPLGERRTLDTAFTLANTGRFAVTLTDLVRGGAAPRPLQLLATDSATASADPGHLHRFHKLRIGPGDSAILVVRWHVGCADGSGGSDAVRLRYEYLSLFKRSQTVALPFAVTLRCGSPQTP